MSCHTVTIKCFKSYFFLRLNYTKQILLTLFKLSTLVKTILIKSVSLLNKFQNGLIQYKVSLKVQYMKEGSVFYVQFSQSKTD